jgi:hypothetical protein
LATEHALLDGNGQRTSSDWFQGFRVVKQAKDAEQSPDSTFADELHLLLSAQERQLSADTFTGRNELEQQLFALGERKAAMPVDEYYAALEAIAL